MPGDTIEVFPPAGETRFKANTVFEITGTGISETIAIHTSCSKAIAVDQVYSGDLTTLTLKELDQTFKSQKGEVCPLAPLKCKGVEGMTLQYFRDVPTSVRITVHEKASEAPFRTFTDIDTGDIFTVLPPDDKTRFKANTIFKIFDDKGTDDESDDTLFETATKHTSCSKPIAVDDVIGTSLIITALELKFE
jgi:hypothetical protein